jgi:hypothetical protein
MQQTESMLTWEGTRIQGRDAIVQKLMVKVEMDGARFFSSPSRSLSTLFQSLTFTTASHQIVSLDAQPTVGNCIVVFVSGNLQVRARENHSRTALSILIGAGSVSRCHFFPYLIIIVSICLA